MKVLVAGYGSVGQYLVDFLIKDHRITPGDLEEIHIISRKSINEVTPRLEISRVAAGISDRFIPIIYHSCDFNNIEETASVIDDISPEIIVYTGRYVPGVKYGSYSYSKDIGYGVWSPLSSVYILKMMKAVEMAKSRSYVINTSFPDLTNGLLCSNGHRLFCGAGNLNHVVPRIKRSVSEILRGSPDNYDIDLVATHYFNTYVSKEGDPKGSPFYLRIIDKTTGHEIVEYRGRLSEYDDNPLVRRIINNSKDNSASGHVRSQMIATDCAEIVRLMCTRESENIHIPGMHGRPGGERFTIISNSKEVKVLRSSNLSHEDCLNINKEGLLFDGVELYRGGVRFNKDVISKMKKEYDISYPDWIHLNEMESFAKTICMKMGWST